MFWARVFVVVLACAGEVQAQTKSEPDALDQSVIKVDVRLVVLHASVRNAAGAIVSGLSRENFRVTEDGSPQTIHDFRSDEVPVGVGLVVDASGSMQNKLPDVIRAAEAFARSANPDDEMFVIKFNEHVSLGLADTKLFSSSPSELRDALGSPIPPGRTALYDAIRSGLDHLRNSTLDRRVLIVISDGKDNASRRTLAQLLDGILRADVAIYTIGLFDEQDEDRNDRVLGQIAAASGGDRFLPSNAADAIRVCERIARDIRTQYTITYSPSNRLVDGKRRSIKIYATGRNGERLRVRTRAGYMAEQGAQP